MTMITPSYLGETIEYSSLHACRSTLEDPTPFNDDAATIWFFKPDNASEDNAFSGARSSDQPEAFSLLNGEVHPSVNHF